INLTIKKDQKIAIVGPNGSGKSTLIKLLLRLYTPTKGRIFINGTDISTFDLIQYQEKFGVVFQDFNLFAWSIKENIIMGKVLDPNKLNDVLEMVGLEERIKSLPDGTETSISQILNKNGVEFSGGEQQKIAIARALYREAPVVIMDEPTAALDPISEADIFNNFDKLTKNKTAIFISHRMSSTQFSDLIYVLEEGKIIDQGTHQMLMEKEGLYYEMYNEQAQYYRTHSRDQEK
ncbi:MAG: ABC transporter ATP-binding protein, partial [Sporolactobacillus sp.]